MISSSKLSVLCPILIGRASQLEKLERVIEMTRGGMGQTVLITGEAGIGKSRLVNEVTGRVVQFRFQILKGNCFEAEKDLPFAPLIDLLRIFGQNNSQSDLSVALGPNAPEFIKLVPEFSIRFPKVTRVSALEPETDKRRLYNALIQFFTQITNNGQTPLMIVIEDLHWSDDTSIEFLLYLSSHIASLPIFLLLTYRLDETNPTLEHFLAELDRQRAAIELAVQCLTKDEMDQMLRAILESDHPVSEQFQQKLYSLTEGNPFFIEEILKVLISSGDIFFEKGRWEHQPISKLHIPRSIKDTVQRRSKNLSGEALHLLELAAAVGRRFDFELLQELTTLDEQALLPLIKELVRAQLVVEDSQDEFSFRHALTREAVYLGLLIRERKRYHALIAEALEHLNADSPDMQLDSLAYHFYEAGKWDKALVYSQRAGEKAKALYAPHAALDHFTHALKAAQHLAVSLPILSRERGQIYEIIGDFEKAQADYEQALKWADKAHNDKFKWQALIDLGFLWSERDYQRTGSYFQQALDLARKMNDPSSLAHSLNRFGNWHANVGNLAEALRFHQQALLTFEKLNDQPGLAETLDLLGMASQINGDLIKGVAHYQRAVELFRELDDRRGLISSLATLALCGPSYIHDTSLSPLNLKEAIEHGEEALKLAQEIGWRSGEIYALHCLSVCLGPQGKVQEAINLTQRGLEISEDIGHDQWLIGAHFDLGALYLEIFGLSQARQHFELALTLAHETGSSLWIGSVTGYLASACILQGDLSRAEEVLDAELNVDTPAQTQMQRLCWCARAELAIARKEPQLVLAIIDRLMDSEPNTKSTASIPRLSKLRSDALAELGHAEEAASELRLAQATTLMQGSLSWSWRIHLALGKIYQNQKRHPEANTESSSAQKIIEQLLASFQDQTLIGIFQTHTATVLPVPAAASAPRMERERFGGLTTREREVAAWIAQGLSNREIAKKLVISERTVESHVTNILAKLDFSSRSRIAAWATEKGLGKPVE